MKYIATELNVLAYANNFTMWHYNHEGSHTDFQNDNFFINAQDMLRKNDLIIINCKDANMSVWVTESTVDKVVITENLLPCITEN